MTGRSETEARRLIAEGLHLCQYGERAPGGDETWPKWARKAEDWLRRDLCERHGHDGGCPECRTSAAASAPVPRRPTLLFRAVPLTDDAALADQPEMPPQVAATLLRALAWCGQQITNEEREQAWAWVEATRGPIEEMGQ